MQAFSCRRPLQVLSPRQRAGFVFVALLPLSISAFLGHGFSAIHPALLCQFL
jgi:hypothetical protein